MVSRACNKINKGTTKVNLKKLNDVFFIPMTAIYLETLKHTTILVLYFNPFLEILSKTPSGIFFFWSRNILYNCAIATEAKVTIYQQKSPVSSTIG